MPDTHDLPDDVADLKRLVREHRLEIERLKIQCYVLQYLRCNAFRFPALVQDF